MSVNVLHQVLMFLPSDIASIFSILDVRKKRGHCFEQNTYSAFGFRLAFI